MIVTLPEATPVHEAAALLEEIRRARIEPFAWVINASLRHSGSVDPLLQRGHPHDLAALAGGRAVGPDALACLASAKHQSFVQQGPSAF